MAEMATAADGTRIAYGVQGPASDVTLVLLHSLAMTRSFWDPVAEILSETARVIALDCRGHGQSDKPAGPYSVELFADDVAAVCEDAGVSRAIVAGASMGGCVALAVAAHHPKLVAGLGLIDTTVWYGDAAETTWNERAEKAASEGLAALVDFQKTRWFSDDFRAANPKVVDAAVEVFLANDVTAYGETCRMLGRCDLRHALSGMTMPVEIFVGEEDYATPPAMARAMRDAIGSAELEIRGGVRHFTPMEVPEAVAAMLQRLAERAA